MSDFFDKLYSNEQLKEYIKFKVSDNSLPHALIFEGGHGSGKTTVALMTAALLEPEYADKILRLATPDVTLHEPTDGKKSIGIALIRDIKTAAYIKPQELSKRIFIIRQAQVMTAEAQNALLKILEEPPQNVYFFLLCENTSLLLPTVRSRAPTLKMSVLEDDELASYMVQTNARAAELSLSSPDEYRMLIRSCDGSIGIAIEKFASSPQSGEATRTQVSELIAFLCDGKKDKTLLFFTKNKFTREALGELLLMLSNALRDMLKTKYGELKSTLFFTSFEEAENLAIDFPRSTLMKLYDASEALRERLNINVNADAYCVYCADVLFDAVRK